MDVWPFAATASFLVAVVAVPALRDWAIRSGFMDVPNERSSHQVPKPRIGGAGIMVGAGAGLAVAAMLGDARPDASTYTLLAVLPAMGLVGLFDDMLSISVGKRMSLYLLGAVVLALFSFRIEVLSLPYLPDVGFGHIGAVVFTALFIGWYTNLFNFMDGIDGIAAGAAVVTCAALAATFAMNDEGLLAAVAASIAAASLAFLIYNRSPASVFMGDVGSVFLGSACGALTVAAVGRGCLSIVAGVLLMFPFVFDASFTLFRRGAARQKVWRAHRSHVYQQMCDLEMGHRVIADRYTVAAAVCAAAGLAYDHLPTTGRVAVLALTIAGGFSVAALVLGRNASRQL